MFRSPLPLRVQLALGYAGFFALVMVLSGAGMVLSVRSVLLREVHQQLQTSSDLIEQDFDASNVGLTEYFDGSNFALGTHPLRVEGLTSPTLYVQVRTPPGLISASSPSLHNLLLPLDDDVRIAVLNGETQVFMTDLVDTPILILARPLHSDRAIIGILEVAQPLHEVERTIRLLVISQVVLGTIALLAVVRGGAWLARRALLPVVHITQVAQQIVRAEDLARRVDGARTMDEVGRLATTINEMVARLESLFTAQSRFVADVSHELRTPLTAMRGSVEVLRRGAARDPDALDESLADIEREVGRLTRLTSDLLGLAQADVGLPLAHEEVSLDDLLLSTIQELLPLAVDVALVPDIAEQVAVWGDPDRLKQALLNVIINALHYTPAGGRVTVALSRDVRWAYLCVRDTGIGIEQAEQAHIFERFYRVDRARSRRDGGSGLGLAIVKWVVEAHGGTVRVSSSVGVGSAFTIALPLASDTPPPVGGAGIEVSCWAG